VPTAGMELSVQHALAGAIACRVKERNGSMTERELGNVVIFGKRAFSKPLQAVLCLQTMATGCKQFRQVPEYKAWVADNTDAIRAWGMAS